MAQQTKIVHVAVGVLQNQHQQILIAKRAEGVHQGGLWEFPGGKVEQGEDVFDALKREFLEEVNLTIHDAQAFMEINHDYGDKHVRLDIWLSREFSGIATGAEGQTIEWVDIWQLKNYEFPEANKVIIDKLQSMVER